jgi:hypothetical protein
MRCIKTSALHRIVAAIADVWDTPGFQPNTHLCAVAVSERIIHDHARQSVMLDQDERVANSRGCGYGCASFFKRFSYIPSNKRFILDNED